MKPGRPPGAPKMMPGAPPGAPRLPRAGLDLPGLHFWSPRASPGPPFGLLFEVIFYTFLDTFFDKNLMQIFTIFRFNLGSILASFWENFGTKLQKKTVMLSRPSRDQLSRAPGHPPSLKNNDFRETVVRNQRSTFSRPGVSGLDF